MSPAMHRTGTMKLSRRIASGLLVVLLAAAHSLLSSAGAQDLSKGPKPREPNWKPYFGEVYTDNKKRSFRRGDTCQPPYTGKPGVIKVDACGRWYCSRADIKDLIEVRPNFAAENKCAWTYKEGTCQCVKQPAPRL